MSGTLFLEIETARLDRVVVDVLAIPFFSCERPLRGAAGRVDWRLCGLLSERLQRGDLTGERGEAALIPAAGRTRSPILLLMGLGPRSEFGEEALRELAGNATRRLIGLRSRSAGMVLPDRVASRLEMSRQASVVTEGVAEALLERPSALRLRLAVPPEEAGRVRRGMLEAAGRLSGSALAIHLDRSPGVPKHPRASGRGERESPSGKSIHRVGSRR